MQQANDLLLAHSRVDDEKNCFPVSEAWGMHNSRAQLMVVDRLFPTNNDLCLQTLCDSMVPLWADRSLLQSLADRLSKQFVVALRQKPEQIEVDK